MISRFRLAALYTAIRTSGHKPLWRTLLLKGFNAASVAFFIKFVSACEIIVVVNRSRQALALRLEARPRSKRTSGCGRRPVAEAAASRRPFARRHVTAEALIGLLASVRSLLEFIDNPPKILSLSHDHIGHPFHEAI